MILFSKRWIVNQTASILGCSQHDKVPLGCDEEKSGGLRRPLVEWMKTGIAAAIHPDPAIHDMSPTFESRRLYP
jgi:hypothetical protein